MKKEGITNEELTKEIIDTVFNYIGISPKTTISASADGVITVNVQGPELNYLIGFKGESLNAMQSILALMLLKKTGAPVMVSVDINDYKAKKSERIIEIAKSYIDKVRFFEKEIALPPMNPWERRQIHVMVAEYPDIESESVGEGMERRLVLKPKKR
jgi:spoIIIJ-associated protein